MTAISLEDAKRPLVLALDIGSSSVRGSLFDGLGRNIRGQDARIPYRMNTSDDGGVEVDADRLAEIAFQAIDKVLAGVGDVSHRGGIAAVAVSAFWHGLMGVGLDGKPVTPLFSWNDTRSARQAKGLRGRTDQRAIHARTGCVLHASYWPAKLTWLRETSPEAFDRVDRWMSIGEFVFLRLFGKRVCSISMASGTGLLNQAECRWDPEALSLVHLSENRLPQLLDSDEPLTGLGAQYAARWPLLADAAWFPPLGDGACGNVGSGCVTRDRAAINLGTSGALRMLWRGAAAPAVPGLWCYRADRRRLVTGGALSNGGDLFAWMNETLRVDVSDVESELAAIGPDAHGLTVLPFLSGERSTGWRDAARGVIAGLTLDTSSIEVLRAGLEAVAYRFAAIFDLLAREVGEPAEVIASGAGALASPEWTQIICDVLGRPVLLSAELEASSRGAVLMALEALGAIQSIQQAETRIARTFSPRREHFSKYAAARQRQEALYARLSE